MLHNTLHILEYGELNSKNSKHQLFSRISEQSTITQHVTITPTLHHHSTPHHTALHHPNNYECNVERTIGALVVMWWLCPLCFNHLGDKIREFHPNTPPSPQHSTTTPHCTTPPHHHNNYEYNVKCTIGTVVVMCWLRPLRFDHLGDKIWTFERWNMRLNSENVPIWPKLSGQPLERIVISDWMEERFVSLVRFKKVD